MITLPLNNVTLLSPPFQNGFGTISRKKRPKSCDRSNTNSLDSIEAMTASVEGAKMRPESNFVTVTASSTPDGFNEGRRFSETIAPLANARLLRSHPSTVSNISNATLADPAEKREKYLKKGKNKVGN